MKKIILLTILICLLVLSCNQETSILKLKKNSGIGIYNRGKDSAKIFYYQSALVSNLPENQNQIK